MLPPRVFPMFLMLLGLGLPSLVQAQSQPTPETTTTTTTTTVVTTTTAAPDPATTSVKLFPSADDASRGVVARYERLREDVEWVAAYLQAKREEAANKPAQDERLAKRIAALQSKDADLGTPEGALKQAQELLDLFFELKARKLQDENTAALLKEKLRKAAEALTRLTENITATPPALVDVQVLADVRLAIARLLGLARDLQSAPAATPSKANRCTDSIWCYELVGSGTQVRDPKKDERRVTNPRIYLVDAYAAYKKLHCSGDTACEQVRQRTRRTLLDALEPEGLRPFIVGIAKPSFVLTTAGDATKADQALVVHFATRPLGGQPSLGVIGNLGIEPVLDMIQSTPKETFSDVTMTQVSVARDGSFTVSSDTTSKSLRKCPAELADKPGEWGKCALVALGNPSFTPKLERAFVWDVGLRLSTEFGGDKWAISAVARAGQILRTQDFTADKRKVKDADGKEREEELFAAQLLGEQGDSNWHYEVGVQIQAFDTALSAREARDLNVRRPVLTAEGGIRWDRRFRNNPAIKDDPTRPAVFGDQPHKRWYARFALERLPVFVDSAKTGGRTDIFLTFAVQHEGKMGALGLPSTTRVYVTGNVGFKL